MTGLSLLVVANLGVGLTCVTFLVAVVIVKVARAAAESSREARVAPFRDAVLTIAAGGDEDGAVHAELCGLRGPAWLAVRDMVVALLKEVRGDTAAALVRLLEVHGEFEHARSELRSRSSVRRARGAYLLGLARRQEDSESLLPLLADRSAEVRLVAARALGSIGDPVAAAPLFQALGPVRGHPGVPTAVVAEALLNLGAGGLSAVVEAMAADDVTERAVATMVAAEGALSAAAPRLREVLAGDSSLDVGISAALALGTVGTVADVAALAAHTAPAQTTALRRAAVQALGELGHPDAVPILSGLLSDSDIRLAQLGGDALVQLGPAGAQALLGAAAGVGQAARVAAGSLAIARLRKVVPPAERRVPDAPGSLR